MSKILALALHLECDPDEISVSRYDDNLFVHGKREYLVCTDEEADELALESLERLAEEMIPTEVSRQFQGYIDTERWAQDSLDANGRGMELGREDGDEHEVCLTEDDVDEIARWWLDVTDDGTREDFDEMYGNDAELDTWFYIYRQS